MEFVESPENQRDSMIPDVHLWRDRNGKIMDATYRCSECGTDICYCTEENVRELYKFCFHCGRRIDWEKTPDTEEEK